MLGLEFPKWFTKDGFIDQKIVPKLRFNISEKVQYSITKWLSVRFGLGDQRLPDMLPTFKLVSTHNSAPPLEYLDDEIQPT